MALKTLGSNANNSLSAFVVGTDDVVAAQVALLNIIKDDLKNLRPLIPNSYVQKGLLVVPNRGVLQCRDGDYIGVDPATGWPILLSADTIANGTWTHS